MSTTNQKKLLEGLAGAGISVTVRSLAKYMASNGVLAEPHIGRRRGYVSMPAGAYGLDLSTMSDKGGSFYNSRVSQGHLCFIPREDEADLAALEKRLRRAVENRTLADGFMPLSAYESLKATFEEIRKAYFEKRDDIVAKWDTLVDDFHQGAKDMLADIQMSDYMRDNMLDAFMAEVPSVEEYKSSFSMDLRVHAFPADVGELEGLNSSVANDVLQTWRDETVSTAILSIEKLVGQSWSKLNAAMKQYMKSGLITNGTIAKLVKFGHELDWKNVFKNPLLADLCGSLKSLQNKDPIDQADSVENAITAIYGYAQEAHLDLSYDDIPYSVKQLEELLFLLNSNMKIEGGAF